MDASTQGTPNPRVDLTRETDVAFWCRVFNLSPDQLREVIHHAGHQPAEIRRYLVANPVMPAQ